MMHPSSPWVAGLSLLLWAASPDTVRSFSSTPAPRCSSSSTFTTTSLFLTPLPKDISPFDKSASKGRDIQGDLRKLATTALEKALSPHNERPPTLLELEFPPLLGGEQSKTQFDDFDSTFLSSLASFLAC